MWLINFAQLFYLAIPATTRQLPCTLNKDNSFFFLPHWWEYMKGYIDPAGVCAPFFHGPSDAWLIALAVLDMLLRIAGFVATISILVAGIEYITAVGNSEHITNARKRIINSLTGLAIALVATLLVTFVGRTFGS